MGHLVDSIISMPKLNISMETEAFYEGRKVKGVIVTVGGANRVLGVLTGSDRQDDL